MDVELPPGMPFPRVTGVEVVPPYGLHLTFADGTSGMVNGSRWLRREPLGVFAPLRDPAEFAKVHLRPDLGTIAWSDDVDLCPDVLYALAHGIALPGVG
jgi:Protein of unknown function (DUF2442)